MNRGDPEWEFDRLVEYIRKLPRSQLRIIDPIRYSEMEECYQAMRMIAKENDGKLTYEVSPECGFGSIQLESNDLVLYAKRGYSRSLMLADNLEVYPLENGKIRTALMFFGITKAIQRGGNE